MKFYTLIRLVFLALVATLVLFTCSLVQGCKILNSAKRISSDTTNVKKVSGGNVSSADSGSVKKDNSISKEEWDWWKTTVINKMNAGDTTINNYIAPGQQPPQVIIYEGGKGKKEEQKNTVDSSWKNSRDSMFYTFMDSMTSRMERIERSSKTQTKGVGLVTLLIAGGVILVLSRVLGRIQFSIKK